MLTSKTKLLLKFPSFVTGVSLRRVPRIPDDFPTSSALSVIPNTQRYKAWLIFQGFDECLLISGPEDYIELRPTE